MKRPFLILLAIAATGGFGYWLVTTPNTLREILLACAGWVLGFWVAAAIQGRRHRRTDHEEDEWPEDTGHDEADFAEDDEAGWDDEDEWDER